jgi:hypothetical protein
VGSGKGHSYFSSPGYNHGFHEAFPESSGPAVRSAKDDKVNSIAENLATPPAPASPAPRPRLGVWMRRILLVVFVLLCIEVGMVLLIVPWTRVWTDNPLLIRNLTLRALALNLFVRGAISGLGLVNLWMGIWEGVHYREIKK